MTKLSPAAQAVLDAYSKYVSEWFKSIKTDKSSSHYHASGLAAALRAALDHVLTAQQILDIAAELEAQ
jgi:selenocysteine lyase/cysteine desulfurase